MTIISQRSIIFFVVYLFTYPVVAYSAMNFVGAIIDYKDVPTSAWKFGLHGNKYIVSIVNDKTQAKQIGLKQGDIILSMDDKDVVSYKDLLGLSAGKHKMKVFNKKNEVDNVIVNIVPSNKENVKESNAEPDLPSIIVNDEVLAKKYGKSEVSKKENRSYQECMDDELANGNTYEYYVNKPNARGGDYGRAQRICDKEYGVRTGRKIERLY